MPVVLSVAVFGALGALSRYGLDLFIERHVGSVFPVSTLVINLSGCVLTGVVVGALLDRLHEPSWLTVGLVMGFLGAYTTFSTFAFETHDLMRASHIGLAVVNVAVSVGAGVGGIYAGLFLAGR